MSDDKLKHKPQKKHTLSEVLKSLQDLIRTDLITAESGAKPSVEQEPNRPPPAPTEPDSFNHALDRLDNMIQHKIIEPVERARDAPPEPLLPDETLEIEWDDPPAVERPETIEGGEAAASARTERDVLPDEETIELQSMPEPADDVGLEVIEIEAPDGMTIDGSGPQNADARAVQDADHAVESTRNDAETADTVDLPPGATAAPSEETIELTAEPAATDAPPASAADESFALTAPPGDETRSPQKGLFDASMETEPAESPASTAASARVEHPTATEPTFGSTDESLPEDPAAARSTVIPTLTVEYDIAGPAAALEGISAEETAQEKPPADAPGADANERERPREQQKPPELMRDTPAPQRQEKPAGSAPATKEEPPTKTQAPPPGKSAPAESPSGPMQEEIPILKEVAELNALPAAVLPDAGQARDIAIRVIAKLNIERRKAGEKPLDIKTIDRLQLYLADALSKRALNKPK